MAPTYKDRELAIATTDVEYLARGDVVVIDRQDETIVKRVAYVAGDSIDYYKIGGEWQCGLEVTFRKRVLDEKFPHRQVRIPDGYVFVLGDNRAESLDSRQFGLVPVSSVTAKLSSARPLVPSAGGPASLVVATSLRR